MMRHRKQIERPQRPHPVPALREVRQVPGQCRRVARHVGDLARAQPRQVLDHLLARARARRVQDDQVALRDACAGQDLVDLALFDADAVQVLEVVAGVLDRALAGLDAEHRALLADALADGSGEEADAW